MNTPETVCLGMNDGIRCTKLISNDAVFCLDCDSGNNDSLPAPLSSCVLTNESREKRNISESQDDENLNDKWILNEQLDTPRAVDVSSTSLMTNRCINCEQNINTKQLFCDKCGFKFGSVCVGEVHGTPCSTFLSVETKFCANCGTANTGNSSAQRVVENKNESVMQLVSEACPRKQASDASISTEEHEGKAADWLHTDDDKCNIARTKSKDQTSLAPRDESNMKLTSLEVAKKIPIDAVMFADGNKGEFEKSLQSLTVDNDSMEENKAIFMKALEEIKDSDEDKIVLEDIKDSDDETIGEILATDLSSGNSEETFEEIGSKGSIINDIQNLLKTKGVIATKKYLTEQVTKWKRAKVKIAVAGQSAAGKSAFINAIRGVVFSDEGYAEEGFGDTTMNIEEYVHPHNKQIIYCDLPGYGTTTITRDKFLEKVNMSEYDMFIIFFTSVPTTDDEWLVIQLREANIPFCFVRTKLDQDIENGKRMGKSKIAVLVDINNAIARATGTIPVLKDEQIFVISNHKPYVGDMSKLVNFMQERVPKIKCEAILFSIPAFTEDIIESKYQDLLRRMKFTTVLQALLDPDSVMYPTIINEIRMYFRVFELDTVYATYVPGLKHHFDNTYVRKVIIDLREKMPCDVAKLIPIYSTIQTYRICKKYLTNLLDELKIDAHKMYKHITTTV